MLERREYIYAILVMQSAPNAWDKNLSCGRRVPRLISLITSAIIVSGTSVSKSLCSNFIIIIIIIIIIIQYTSKFIFKKI